MLPTETGFYFLDTNDSRDDGLCLVLYDEADPEASQVHIFGEESPGRTIAYYIDDPDEVTWSGRIKTPEEGRFLDKFDDSDLIISSFRYYLGRKTTSVSCFARQLAKAWPDLSENVQEIIKRDLEQAFVRDDIDREEDREFCQLGHDCDRRSWELVRSKYTKNNE